MFNPFICGSFHHPEEEDDEPWSPRSPPRKSRKGSMCRSSRDSKNPYANRGLDKFSALLADLEDKRQKIYTQKGSEEISFVRFAYTNSDDWRPIVVKVRDHRKHDKTNLKDKPVTHNSEALITTSTTPVMREVEASDNQKTKKMSFTWDLRRPSYYLPAIIILILFFLAMFGRSFAILCTSLGWYLVPTIKGVGPGRLNLKRQRKKKEYVRKLSENKIISDGSSSPTSVITGALNDTSPRHHGHRKSW